MAAIKPIDQSSDKWQRRASAAGEDYSKGVENPRRSWATATADAGPSYRQGVTAAAAAGRFEAGVRRAGDEKWRRNAMEKGPTRFSEGVRLAVGEWQKGFAPYQAGIAGLALAARGPTGSEANYQRAVMVGKLNRMIKERLGGTR